MFQPYVLCMLGDVSLWSSSFASCLNFANIVTLGPVRGNQAKASFIMKKYSNVNPLLKPASQRGGGV